MKSKIKVKYPIGIRWKILEEDLQELRSSIDGFLESDSFEIPETDIEHYISIFPNGNNDKNRGETYIFLHLDFEEQKEIEAEFYISVESANFIDENEYVYKKSYGYGASLCTVDELFDPEYGFIVNGEMVIKVEGFAMIEKNAPDISSKIDVGKNELCLILWNQENKDFTIVADGKEIHAHKCVLSGRSPIFEAMFKPHTQEAQEGKVVIPDFSFSVVEAAIKFCYDSSLVENVSFEDQLSLLQFFDKYDMDSLKNRLENHLIAEINVTNVCILANCSLISNSLKLRRECSEFLLECIKTAAVKDFDILDKDFAFDLLKKSMISFSG